MRRTDVTTAGAVPPATIRRGRRPRRRPIIGTMLALVVLVAAACVAEGAWASTTVPDPALPGPSTSFPIQEVGCTTADDCLAVAWNGLAAAYDGTWSTISPLPEPLAEAQVACLPAGPCLVAGIGASAGAGVWSWSGTAWSGNLFAGALPAPPASVSISCGPLDCVVAGGTSSTGSNQAYALRFDGSTFTDLGVPASTDARAALAASCPTASVCVISTRFANGNAEILRVDGTTWTTLTPARATGYLSELVCTTADACTGLSPETFCARPVGCYTFNRLATWEAGGAWTQQGTSTSFPGPSYTELDCVATDDCVLARMDVGSVHELVTWDGTTVTTRATLPGPVLGLDCAADGRCVAVANDPLRDRLDPEASPDGVRQPLFLHLDDTGLRSDRSVSGPAAAPSSRFTDVMCLSPTSCIAVGWAHQGDRQRSLVGTFDGTAWTVAPAPTVDDVRLESITCTSPTSCVAVGGRYELQRVTGNVIRTFDGTTWTELPGDLGEPGFYDRGLTEVACSTATRCVATTDIETLTNWDGAWRVAAPHGSYAPNSSACLPGGPCYFAIGERLSEWTGSGWQDAPLPPTETEGGSYGPLVQGVGCATSGPAPRCLVAIGAYSNLDTHLLAEGGPEGWTKTLPTAADAEDTVDELTCSTIDQCVVIGGEGISQEHVRNGGDWIPLPPRNLPDAVSLSCVPNRCVHVGNVTTVDGVNVVVGRRPAAEVYDLKPPPA